MTIAVGNIDVFKLRNNPAKKKEGIQLIVITLLNYIDLEHQRIVRSRNK